MQYKADSVSELPGEDGDEWKGRTEDLELILFLLPNVTNQLVMFSSNNLIC